MAHRQAIESELSMCVEELRMLQASALRTYDYRLVLLGLLEKMVEIPELIEGSNPISSLQLKVHVYMINEVVRKAHISLKTLDITDWNDWKRVFGVVKQLNATFSILEFGAGFIDKKLEKVCTALSTGTSISSEANFLGLRASKNAEMLNILSKVGRLLADARGGDENFYGFLGPRVKKKMEEIITLLTRRY